MKKCTTALVLVLLSAITSAQSIPTYCISFGSGSSGTNLCGVATFDGGYVVGGVSHNGGIDQNNYIAKYDGNGNIAWQHEVGNGSTNDFNGITETSDHHILVAGYLNGKMVVIKYTAGGVQLWAKNISVLSLTYGHSIIETSDGNILVSGASYDFSHYYTVVVKLDSDGNLLWNKNFNVVNTSDDGYGCVETADHHYIIEIYGASLNDFFYILALDTSGNQLWSKQSANSGVAEALIATADSGVVVAGYVCLTANCDAMLNKLDKNGNLLWSYTYGDSLLDEFYSVTSTSDEGFAMAGDATDQSNNRNGFVAKTDSNGQLQWSKTTDDRVLRSIDNSTDGGLIVSSTRGLGSLEFGLKKLDEEGNSCCTLTNYGTQHSGTSFSDVTVSSYVVAATITDATMDEITFIPTINESCNEVGIVGTKNENSDLKIFPDPADDHLTIQNFSSNNLRADLFVMDEEGRIAMKILSNGFSSGKDIEVNTSLLPPSAYLLVLKTSEKILTHKFITQR